MRGAARRCGTRARLRQKQKKRRERSGSGGVEKTARGNERLILFVVQERQLHAAFFWFGKTIKQGRCVRRCGRIFFFWFHRRWFQRGTQRAFDKLGAMNFHRRQRAKFAGEILGLECERLLGGFAADQFRREAGDGNRRFAAEGLERGAV